MTKQEYLNSLPFFRKVDLYVLYLEYNKYYDDLKGYYDKNLNLEDWFDKDDFNSYKIARMIESHSNCLSNEEWEVYKDLDDEDLLF